MSKVSVLLPVYNNKEDVIHAINSIFSQTYVNWELIIIDDCSTDGSFEMMKSHFEQFVMKCDNTNSTKNLDTKNINNNELIKQDVKIVIRYKLNSGQDIILLRNEINHGTYISLNEGLLVAKGDYITVLGSDDVFHRAKLKTQIDILDYHPEKVCVVGMYIREGRKPMFGEVTMMFRKSIIERIGYHDSVRFGADSEFFSRILATYGVKGLTRLKKVLYYAKKRNRSLTTSTNTGMTGLGLELRKDYKKRYITWHKKSKELFMPYPLTTRPFEVHPLMTKQP